MSIMHPNIHMVTFIFYQKQALYGYCRGVVQIQYSSFLTCKDQDQTNVHSLFAKQRYTPSLSVTNDQVKQKFCSSKSSGTGGRGVLDYSGPDRNICNGHYNFIYPPILHENSDLLSKSATSICQLYPLWKWKTNSRDLSHKYSISSNLFSIKLEPREKRF
ncbi:hypothetical protein MKX03_029728, partial [Papaver bracteatum]